MDIKKLHKISDSVFQTHITDAAELPELQSFLDELREKAEDVEGSDYFSEEINATVNGHSVVGKVDHRAGRNYYVSVTIDSKNVYLSEDPTHVVLPESIDDLDIPDSLAGVIGAGSILDGDNLQRSLETYLQDKIGTDGKWTVNKVTDGNPHLEVNIEFAKDAAQSANEIKSYIQGVFKGFDGNGYDGYVSEAKDAGSSWKVKAFIYQAGVTPDVSEDYDEEPEKEVSPEDIGDSKVMDSDQLEQFAMDILTKKHGTCPVTHHKYTIKGDILYMDGEEKLHLSQSVFTALQQILRVIKKAKPIKDSAKFKSNLGYTEEELEQMEDDGGIPVTDYDNSLLSEALCEVIIDNLHDAMQGTDIPEKDPAEVKALQKKFDKNSWGSPFLEFQEFMGPTALYNKEDTNLLMVPLEKPNKALISVWLDDYDDYDEVSSKLNKIAKANYMSSENFTAWINKQQYKKIIDLLQSL